MQYLEIHVLPYCGFDVLDAGIAEFHHLSAFSADEVVVLPVLKCFFELCKILAELMLPYQVAGKKEFDGIV